MSREDEGIRDGDRIGMAFVHGSFDHPVYGKANNLHGVIPILQTHGNYKFPPIATDKPRLDKLVRALTHEYQDLWEDELEDKIAAKVKDYLFFLVFTNPQDEPETPGMLALISNCIVLFAMDDIADEMDGALAGNIKYSDVCKRQSLYMGLCDGVYKRIEDIPNSFPAMSSTIGHLWKACRKLEDAIPNSKDRREHLRNEWIVCLNTFILLMEKDPPGEGFSEQSLKVYETHNTGMILLLEVVAMLRNVTLRPEIRRDILVQNITYQMANAGTLMNAVFGFARDVNLDQVQDSTILRQVVQKGVSLEKAFNEALTALCEEINDIRVGIRKLRDRYVEEKDLMDWVRLVENVVDGQIYCYRNLTRYGNLDMKVVKI